MIRRRILLLLLMQKRKEKRIEVLNNLSDELKEVADNIIYKGAK
jgi:hypothetical protein